MSKVDPALLKRNKEAMKHASPLFDQLNQTWEKIEQFFRKQGILRPVRYPFSRIEVWTGGGPELVGQNLIGIQKHSGKWRICYAAEHENEMPDSISWTPVSDCGTELRIEMLNHVQALFKKLVETNEKYIPEIEQGVAKSQEVLSELGIAD